MNVEDMSPDLSARIRLAQGIEHSEELNERFADYAQSTAFSISLSRHMVVSLLSLANAIEHRHERARRPIHDNGLLALERRGLITVVWQPRLYSDEAKQCATWANTTEITTAGKLILQLLAEAGQAPRILSPMPPPPPGWVDPRPKIEIGALS